jgi:hypothetical protein
MKRSGKDEPMWVVIHKCMEARPGISLYSYLYIKPAKRYVFLIISYVFSSTKLGKRGEQVLLGSKGVGEEEGRRGTVGRDGPNTYGEMAQFIHL